MQTSFFDRFPCLRYFSVCAVFQAFYGRVIYPISSTLSNALKALVQKIRGIHPTPPPPPTPSFFNNKPTPVVIGMPNEGGNDCFLIALYQFLQTPALQEHLVKNLPAPLNTLFSSSTNSSKMLRAAVIAHTAFGRVIDAQKRDRMNSQQDPAEAFESIIESLNLSDNPLTTHLTIQRLFQLQGDNLPDYVRNHEEFGGLHHQKTARDFQLKLALPMDLSQSNTLQELLNNFFITQQQQQDPFKVRIPSQDPSVTQENYAATVLESVRMESAPDYLTLNFKRFGFDEINLTPYKIEDPIQGVNLQLTLTPEFFHTPTSSPVTYELQSFICHRGDSPCSGHYVAYRKTANGWYYCNDSQTQRITDQEAATAAQLSYLTFYQKIS